MYGYLLGHQAGLKELSAKCQELSAKNWELKESHKQLVEKDKQLDQKDKLLEKKIEKIFANVSPAKRPRLDFQKNLKATGVLLSQIKLISDGKSFYRSTYCTYIIIYMYYIPYCFSNFVLYLYACPRLFRILLHAVVITSVRKS